MFGNFNRQFKVGGGCNELGSTVVAIRHVLGMLMEETFEFGNIDNYIGSRNVII
jgi:hypothetical protein